MSSAPLAGRTALITGASSGLGSGFAQLLSANGAAVGLAARRTELLAPVCDALIAGGARAASVGMDVTNEASVVGGFDEIESALGPIDTVIANAGMNIQGTALDVPVEAFDDILAVNLRGAFLTAREAARRMIARGQNDNRIVFIASIGGLEPLPGLAAYSASKAAIVMLGRSLAREWASHSINVNVLCPGYVRTDLNADWFAGDAGQRQINRFPRKRLIEQDGLNAMLLLLAGPGSAAMTGSVVTVDDGQTL